MSIHKVKMFMSSQLFEESRGVLAETELLLDDPYRLKNCNSQSSIKTEESSSSISCRPFDLLLKKFKNGHILLSQAMHPAWNETSLPEYNSFADYIYAVIMFAYVTCFSVILPITPLFILINTLLSMRVDAYKLCHGRRR